MKEKIESILKIIWSGTVLSVVFVSSVFLGDVISYKWDGLAWGYIFLAAGLYGVMFWNVSGLNAFLSWLVSLPLSYFVLQYFWKTHYAIRALNWAIPYYGENSAGENFAGSIRLFVFAVLCLVGIGVGMSCKSRDEERTERKRLVFGTVAAGVVIFFVLWLESKFPPYEAIEVWLNS